MNLKRKGVESIYIYNNNKARFKFLVIKFIFFN